jgi:hypothetical protein
MLKPWRKPRRHNPRARGEEKNEQAIRPPENSERAAVTGDNLDAKRWGLGLGFVLGIILAILSLSEIPFLGGSRLRDSSPDLQNREEQTAFNRFDRMADLSQPSDLVQRPTVMISQEHPRAASTVISPVTPRATVTTARVAPNPVAQKLVAADQPQRSVLSPLVPPPRELPEEDPETLLKHARFLIRAGLAPIAKVPLREVVRDAPGTPIAREAQLTLDSISRN